MCNKYPKYVNGLKFVFTLRVFSYFIFSGNIEVTVEFLTEIDKLVQLLESPIFACMYHFLYVIL